VQSRIGRANPRDFRIADTFTENLARLTGEQQKAIKTALSQIFM
jgi:hypothetical protein